MILINLIYKWAHGSIHGSHDWTLTWSIYFTGRVGSSEYIKNSFIFDPNPLKACWFDGFSQKIATPSWRYIKFSFQKGAKCKLWLKVPLRVELKVYKVKLYISIYLYYVNIYNIRFSFSGKSTVWRNPNRYRTEYVRFGFQNRVFGFCSVWYFFG